MTNILPPELPFTGETMWDGGFGPNSPWYMKSTIKPQQHIASWVRRDAIGGFLDFSLVFRPHHKGVSVNYPAVAYAVTWLDSPCDTEATFNGMG